MIERMIERMKQAQGDERSFVTLPMIWVLLLVQVMILVGLMWVRG